MKYSIILSLLFISTLKLCSQISSEIEGNLLITDTLTVNSLSSNGNNNVLADENGLLYIDSTKKYQGITAAAFTSSGTFLNSVYFKNNGLWVDIGDPDFLSNLNLPRNVTITELTLFFVDLSPTGDLTLILEKHDPLSNLTYIMASISTTGTPSSDLDDVVSISTSSINFNNITSDFHSLRILANEWDNRNLRFQGLLVEYVVGQ